MARASKNSITVEAKIPIEVSRLKMKRSPAMDYVDGARLAKAANAEFEVGHIVVGKTKKAVLAVVKKGHVVGMKMADCEGCADAAPSKELMKLFQDAASQLDPTGGQPPAPIPVEVFLKQPPIETSHCTLHCIRIFGICWICCTCCSVSFSIGGCTVITGTHVAV